MNVFTVDSRPIVGKISNIEEQQNLKQQCCPKSIEKINKWIQTKQFQSNPVQFLYDWKSKHPKEILLDYDRFESHNHAWPRGNSIGGHAFVYLSKIVMGDEQFIPSFISWVKANAGQLVQQLHNKTDAETCEKVKKVFLNTVSSNEFVTDLNKFRDFVIGKKYPDNVDSFGSLKFVLRFPLVGASCPDIIGRHALQDVKSVIWDYFDFTHAEN